jgi:hypothetical protein
MARLPLLLLLFFGLSSCSQTIEVRAEFRGGKLHFVGDDDDKTWHPWCLEHFKIVDVDGLIAWEFEIPFDVRSKKTACGPNLPIIYGFAPDDAVVATQAQQLRHGKRYIIDGSGGGLYHGAFRYERQILVRRRIENIEIDAQTVNRALGYGGQAR